MEKSSPWVMTQTWEHLLFMHWEIDPDKIKPLIPSEIDLDLFEGKAWITVLPFKVTHQRFRLLPEIPLLNTYLELNVRTYVKFGSRAGVYFFTLDANHLLVVCGSKATSLPYRFSKMNLNQQKKEIIFKSNRVFDGATFSAVYEPISPPAPTVPGSLDHWLLERYCLFTKWGDFLLRGDICHKRWEICRAKVKVVKNSVTPFELTSEPVLFHYSLRKEAFIFPLKKV